MASLLLSKFLMGLGLLSLSHWGSFRPWKSGMIGLTRIMRMSGNLHTAILRLSGAGMNTILQLFPFSLSPQLPTVANCPVKLQWRLVVMLRRMMLHPHFPVACLSTAKIWLSFFDICYSQSLQHAFWGVASGLWSDFILRCHWFSWSSTRIQNIRSVSQEAYQLIMFSCGNDKHLRQDP